MFLTGLIIGAAQPATLYAGGETGDGSDLWSQFIDTSGFKGTVLNGTLSILYYPNPLADLCSTGQQQATMFYSVRFIVSKKTMASVGAAAVCLLDIAGQGEEIMNFLTGFVNKNILTINKCVLKAINNSRITDGSYGFVADITLVCQ